LIAREEGLWMENKMSNKLNESKLRIVWQWKVFLKEIGLVHLVNERKEERGLTTAFSEK